METSHNKHEDEKLRPIVSAADDLAWVISDSIRALRASSDCKGLSTTKADLATLKELTSTLKTLAAVIRDINGLPTYAECDASSLAHKKLEFERSKAVAADTTVSFILDADAKEAAE